MKICFSKIHIESKLDWILALGLVILQLLTSYFFPDFNGYSGFLPFIFLLGRFLGVYHPDVEFDEPLDLKRKILGWLTVVIFLLCFCPNPFIVY